MAEIVLRPGSRISPAFDGKALLTSAKFDSNSMGPSTMAVQAIAETGRTFSIPLQRGVPGSGDDINWQTVDMLDTIGEIITADFHYGMMYRFDGTSALSEQTRPMDTSDRIFLRTQGPLPADTRVPSTDDQVQMLIFDVGGTVETFVELRELAGPQATSGAQFPYVGTVSGNNIGGTTQIELRMPESLDTAANPLTIFIDGTDRTSAFTRSSGGTVNGVPYYAYRSPTVNSVSWLTALADFALNFADPATNVEPVRPAPVVTELTSQSVQYPFIGTVSGSLIIAGHTIQLLIPAALASNPEFWIDGTNVLSGNWSIVGTGPAPGIVGSNYGFYESTPAQWTTFLTAGTDFELNFADPALINAMPANMNTPITVRVTV